MLEFKYIEHGLLKSNQHGYTHRWEILINIYQSSIKTIGCLYIYLSRFVIAIHSTLGRRNANFGQAGADLGGGCRGCAPPPPPPEMTCGFLIQLVFCKKNYVVFLEETSAPPPKKNPGSAPVKS